MHFLGSMIKFFINVETKLKLKSQKIVAKRVPHQKQNPEQN